MVIGRGTGAWRRRTGAPLRLAALAFLFCLIPFIGATYAQENAQRGSGTFRIGMLADPGTGSSLPRLPSLKRAYALALGVPVEFFVAADYRTLIEAQADKRIDYAIYSASAYAAAALACDCVEPLVAPTSGSGALGIRSILIARQGGPTGIADMAKYRVAIGAPEDIAAFQLPLSSLRNQGVSLTGREPFLVSVPVARDAEDMLRRGEVDAIFGWIETGIDKAPIGGAGTLQRLKSGDEPADSASIVWTSELLRFGPHAIRKDLAPEIRRRLVPFLTALRESDPDLFDVLARYHTGGFVSVTEADYSSALDMVRASVDQ